MVNLHDQIGSPRISILLVDISGQILDMVGEECAKPQASEHWPSPNVRSADRALARSEHRAAGTSGRGSSVFGIAAPINAASGGLIGILDRSGGPGMGMQHIGAMLQLTAETIERRVVESDARGFLVLRFHTRIELLEGPCDAIALFDCDSRLIAYNKLAANLLSLSRNGLNARCQDFFETQWPGLVGSAAFAKNSPIHLRAKNGTNVLAHARLR
jgi:transcriptional regulator of acetoin/glycerol metabolism